MIRLRLPRVSGPALFIPLSEILQSIKEKCPPFSGRLLLPGCLFSPEMLHPAPHFLWIMSPEFIATHRGNNYSRPVLAEVQGAVRSFIVFSTLNLPYDAFHVWMERHLFVDAELSYLLCNSHTMHKRKNPSPISGEGKG